MDMSVADAKHLKKICEEAETIRQRKSEHIDILKRFDALQEVHVQLMAGINALVDKVHKMAERGVPAERMLDAMHVIHTGLGYEQGHCHT